MSLGLTLALFIAATVVFAVATLVARRPAMPGRVHLIPMGALQFIALVVMLITAAHLISFVMGRPLTSRYFG
jgi:hypothetical protein